MATKAPKHTSACNLTTVLTESSSLDSTNSSVTCIKLLLIIFSIKFRISVGINFEKGIVKNLQIIISTVFDLETSTFLGIQMASGMPWPFSRTNSLQLIKRSRLIVMDKSASFIVMSA